MPIRNDLPLSHVYTSWQAVRCVSTVDFPPRVQSSLSADIPAPSRHVQLPPHTTNMAVLVTSHKPPLLVSFWRLVLSELSTGRGTGGMLKGCRGDPVLGPTRTHTNHTHDLATVYSPHHGAHTPNEPRPESHPSNGSNVALESKNSFIIEKIRVSRCKFEPVRKNGHRKQKSDTLTHTDLDTTPGLHIQSVNAQRRLSRLYTRTHNRD